MQLVYSVTVGLLIGLSTAIPTGSKRSNDAQSSDNPHHLFSRAVDFTQRTSCADDSARYVWDATNSIHSKSIRRPTETAAQRLRKLHMGARVFMKEYNLGVARGQIAHCRLVLGSIEAADRVATPEAAEEEATGSGARQSTSHRTSQDAHRTSHDAGAPLAKRVADHWTFTDTQLYEVRFSRDDKSKTELHVDLWHRRGINRRYDTKLGAVIDPLWTHERVYNEAKTLEVLHPEYFKLRTIPLLPGAGPAISTVKGKLDSTNCEDFYEKMKVILSSPPPGGDNYVITYVKPSRPSDAGSSLNRTPINSDDGHQRAEGSGQGHHGGGGEGSGADAGAGAPSDEVSST